MQRLAALESAVPQHQDEDEDLRAETPPPREATPRKQALWKTVHHARLQGVSLRGIAQELGIQGTRSGSTLIPGATRQPNSQTVTPISSSPQCWRSFPLSTYPHIFAGQRHHVTFSCRSGGTDARPACGGSNYTPSPELRS